MKKIAIMQPYLFPYVGYWQLINAVDEFVIYDDVNYIKKGFINRNFILSSNKKESFKLILELEKASQNKLINEIQVGENQKKIIKIIQQTYKKAPYFKNTFLLFEQILLFEEKNLARFLGNSIQKISNYLDINTKLIYSSEIDKNIDLKGEEKIINIVNSRASDIYINPIGGIELYNKENFQKEGIELKFLKSSLEDIKYKQFNNNFIPSLSIIDLMMFNNKDTIKQYLERYELI